jgi:hypothetical protein
MISLCVCGALSFILLLLESTSNQRVFLPSSLINAEVYCYAIMLSIGLIIPAFTDIVLGWSHVCYDDKSREKHRIHICIASLVPNIALMCLVSLLTADIMVCILNFQSMVFFCSFIRYANQLHNGISTFSKRLLAVAVFCILTGTIFSQFASFTISYASVLMLLISGVFTFGGLGCLYLTTKRLIHHPEEKELEEIRCIAHCASNFSLGLLIIGVIVLITHSCYVLIANIILQALVSLAVLSIQWQKMNTSFIHLKVRLLFFSSIYLSFC